MRKLFLKSKDEKKIWGMLSEDEQATSRKCSIFLAIGGILTIAGVLWLAFFTPTSETLIGALACIISAGIIIMLSSMKRYDNILARKLVSKNRETLD